MNTENAKQVGRVTSNFCSEKKFCIFSPNLCKLCNTINYKDIVKLLTLHRELKTISFDEAGGENTDDNTHFRTLNLSVA